MGVPVAIHQLRVSALAFFVLLGVVGAADWLYTPDRQREQLEADYAGPPSEFVQIEGLRLHLRDTGPRDAPVVMMLHGFGSSLHTWEPWANALSDNYRVLRLDLPGFGLTGPDPSGDYSDARSDRVLTALMDRLSISRTALVGNSLGGRMAWRFASEHPERVSKLVLVSPDGFASPGFAYGKKAEVPLLAGLLPYTLPSSMLRANLASAYGNPAALTREIFLRYRDLMLAPGNRRAMIARLKQIELQPPEPMLARIRAPVLLVWGEKDAMIPPSNAGDYMRNLPQSRLVTLPGLGHVPQEEAPLESLTAVRAFLGQSQDCRDSDQASRSANC